MYGFGGVVTNPPHDASYLQAPETLETLNDVVQALHAKGYRVWLYDEKGYPSGSAGDLIAAFLKEEPISQEEREKLRKILDDMEV